MEQLLEYMTLALIAPTPLESKVLRLEIKPMPRDELKIISEGELHGKSITFTHCGVGKVNAAHSATLMLENYEIELLILFGIGGAYNAHVKIGDVVVAETENYGEEGVFTKDGWSPMEKISPLLRKEKEYFNTFPLELELSKLAVEVARDLGFDVTSGNFVTVSQVSGTRESGELLKNRFDGICENMEGAAVAHICALYGVPMVEIRGISNIVGERDIRKWNIPLASSHANNVVSELAKRL